MSAVADKVRYVRDAGWAERALEDPRNAYWGDPLHPERELDLDDAYETQRDREAFAAARGRRVAGAVDLNALRAEGLSGDSPRGTSALMVAAADELEALRARAAAVDVAWAAMGRVRRGNLHDLNPSDLFGPHSDGCRACALEAAVAATTPPVKYVVGLAFTPNLSRVALIEKRRPAWQAGFLNGVGGGVEPGESPAAAMAREGDEEAGLAGLEWVEFLTYDDARGYRVAFYRATLGARQDPVSRTDEQVSLERVDDVCADRLKVVHNIPWLVTMAVAHAKGAPGYAIAERSGGTPWVR